MRKWLFYSGTNRILSWRTVFELLSFFILACSIMACSRVEDLSELDPFLRKSVTWKCEKLNKEIPLNIYFLEDSTGEKGAEVIVYVKNNAWERVGKESDLSILRDNIRNKFIVITVDFGNETKAVSTFIDKDLHDIFRAVYGTNTE